MMVEIVPPRSGPENGDLRIFGPKTHACSHGEAKRDFGAARNATSKALEILKLVVQGDNGGSVQMNRKKILGERFLCCGGLQALMSSCEQKSHG